MLRMELTGLRTSGMDGHAYNVVVTGHGIIMIFLSGCCFLLLCVWHGVFCRVESVLVGLYILHLQFCCNSQRLNTGSFGKDGQSSSSCTVSQNSKGELLTTIKQYFHRLQCINVSPDQTSVTAP